MFNFISKSFAATGIFLQLGLCARVAPRRIMTEQLKFLSGPRSGACDSVAFLVSGPGLLWWAGDSNHWAGEACWGPCGQLGCRAGGALVRGKPACGP